MPAWILHSVANSSRAAPVTKVCGDICQKIRMKTWESVPPRKRFKRDVQKWSVGPRSFNKNKSSAPLFKKCYFYLLKSGVLRKLLPKRPPRMQETALPKLIYLLLKCQKWHPYTTQRSLRIWTTQKIVSPASPPIASEFISRSKNNFGWCESV